MSKTRRQRLSTFLSLLFMAGAVSLALFGALSWQMAKGQDPVLALQKSPVVHKKIVVVKRVREPRKTIYTRAESPMAASSTTYYSSEPTYSEPTYSEPTYSEPTYSEPTYSTPEPVVSSAS